MLSFSANWLRGCLSPWTTKVPRLLFFMQLAVLKLRARSIPWSGKLKVEVVVFELEKDSHGSKFAFESNF